MMREQKLLPIRLKSQPRLNDIETTSKAAQFLHSGKIHPLTLVRKLITGEYGNASPHMANEYRQATIKGMGEIRGKTAFGNTIILVVARAAKVHQWQFWVMFEWEYDMVFNPETYAAKQEAARQAMANRQPIETKEQKPTVTMSKVHSVESLAAYAETLEERIQALEERLNLAN